MSYYLMESKQLHQVIQCFFQKTAVRSVQSECTEKLQWEKILKNAQKTSSTFKQCCVEQVMMMVSSDHDDWQVMMMIDR